MKIKDREALIEWEEFRKNLIRATAVDMNEDALKKEARIHVLKEDIIAFAKYYFPHYCTSDFAAFHKKFFKTVIENDRIYVVLEIAREHAKSVCAGIILPIYLMFTGKLKNMLLVSYNETNATELLRPLKIELESNQRIINDFGLQRGASNWEDGKLITTGNCSFRSIGSGQSPRGTRNQEVRPDYILCDDMDEDEQSRNPKRVSEAFDWANGALLGCFSIEKGGRFIVVGNRIAQETILGRAVEKADVHVKANIYDDQGNVSWKERYTKEMCEYMIQKMGYRLSQREYFNNPINEGKVFSKDWFVFKKLPPMRKYKFLVAYLDPGFKKTKGSDSKAWIVIGLYEGKFHVRKVFCNKASIEEMVEWGYAIDKFLKHENASAVFKMEEVFLQDLLYKDFASAAKSKGYALPVSGDQRKKPDKDARIEATSGYFERGDVYFDEEIEKDHHTQKLIEQYLNFQPGVKTLKDGPDCMEGGMHILTQMLHLNNDIKIIKRPESDNRL